MPEISKITLPSGTTYDLKDAYARDLIAELHNFREYLGITTTVLTDGCTTNPITINGESVTAESGDVATYDTEEFIFNGTIWQKFGDLTSLGALAYKNSASGSFTPTGTVSQPSFSGSEMTSTGSVTPSGTVSVTTATTENKTATVAPAGSGEATYTPAGSCTGANVSLTTTTVNSITAVGSLPELTTNVSNETLTIGWSAGSLPTKGSNTTVATGVDTITQPTFSGTGVRLVTDNIAVPATYTGSFSGTAASVSVTGTPSGTVSQPSFSGTAGTVTVS